MRRSAVQYEAMGFCVYWPAHFGVSALYEYPRQGKLSVHVISPWVCALALAVLACTQLGAVGRRHENGTRVDSKTVAGKERRDGRALLCKLVHDSLVGVASRKGTLLQERQRRGVSMRPCSFPLVRTSRVHTRTVSPENALAACTRATEMLFDRYKCC